jgi:CRP-like cAMP-binding protein
MALENDIAFLNRIPTFHVLGREALRILAISIEDVHLRSGEVLFEEGEPADGGFVVREGALMVKSARERPGGSSAVARPGTLIGETALIVDTRFSATATALEHTMLWRISRGVFLRMLESEPNAAIALRRVIGSRLDAAIADLDLVVPVFETDLRERDEAD